MLEFFAGIITGVILMIVSFVLAVQPLKKEDNTQRRVNRDYCGQGDYYE